MSEHDAYRFTVYIVGINNQENQVEGGVIA